MNYFIKVHKSARLTLARPDVPPGNPAAPFAQAGSAERAGRLGLPAGLRLSAAGPPRKGLEAERACAGTSGAGLGRLHGQDLGGRQLGLPERGSRGPPSPGGALPMVGKDRAGGRQLTPQRQRSAQNRQAGGGRPQEALEQRIWVNKLPHLFKKMAPGLKNTIKTITHILPAAQNRKDYSLMRVMNPWTGPRGSRGPPGGCG